jgi:hypothetical protein
MIADWTDEFDRLLTNAEEHGGKLLEVAVALLQALDDLPAKPDEEPLPSSESGRPAAMSCGGPPTPTTPASPSGSSASSPPATRSCPRWPGSTRSPSGTCSTPARARGEAIVDAWLRQKEILMTEEVKFIRGDDRISQLAQRPDIADGVPRVRAEMAEADRTYATGLAALRQAAELTQAELARRLGVTQAAISRIEQPHDLLLSTLNSYLGAIGGRASVIVTFADGHQTTLELSQLR